jgi:hypothetical protein
METTRSKLLSNGIGVIYSYSNHSWVNTELPCGCIEAVCLDVLPSDEDTRFVKRYFGRLASIKMLMKFTKFYDGNPASRKREYAGFRKGYLESRDALLNFIRQKQETHGFPNNTDLDVNYFIKLKLCRN